MFSSITKTNIQKVLQTTDWDQTHIYLSAKSTAGSGIRRKFSWGGFIQWHMVVICIWCVLIVTSQFDVMFMFSSEVC